MSKKTLDDVFHVKKVSLQAIDSTKLKKNVLNRLQEVSSGFGSSFGYQPDVIVSVPGRINLIGEHIDYEGYSVLAMAINKNICIAMKLPKNKQAIHSVCLRNKAKEYEEITLELDTCPSGYINWGSYFVCGYQGIKKHYKSIDNSTATTTTSTATDDRQEAEKNKETTAHVFVDGTIPPACGLSSSSAFVVASSLVSSILLSRINSFPTLHDLADICRQAEHLIGTMGGGMDQAIACLGQENMALHIKFDPLRTEPIQLPTDYVFIVTNSLQKAEKAVDTSQHFNKRVVECTLASFLLAKHLGIASWKECRTLRQVQERAPSPSQSLSQMQSLVRKWLQKDAYTRQELEKEFQVDDLVQLFQTSQAATARLVLLSEHNTTNSTFKLQQRALHVYSEAERVELFCNLCKRPQETEMLGIKLGQLMIQSHQSCRDLYECSTNILDQLVNIALNAGALGARLTGAGWGGAVLSLVHQTQVDTFITKIQNDFYYNHDHDHHHPTKDESIFVSTASIGAQVFISSDIVQYTVYD